MGEKKNSWDNPVFRSSEGTPVKRSNGHKKGQESQDINETTPPDLKSMEDSSELAKNEKRDVALARLELCSSQDEMQDVLKEYNAQFSETNDMGAMMHFAKVSELHIGSKDFIVYEYQGGVEGLHVQEKETFPSETQIKKAWSLIEEDKQLRGILSALVNGDFDQRNSLEEQDVRNFYEQFDSIDSYMKNAKISEFLVEIQQANSREKFQEYNEKAIKFVDIMFPGQ